jgi:hypothetical protein
MLRVHASGRHRDLRSAGRGPWILVGAAVAWGLILLWPERADVWYLNDASVHRSMVEWAAGRFRAGHIPFDGWYPYLGLGASRFHHYQSLPHILTGAAWSVLGRGVFGWSLYLLLATWPVSVFHGGRLLRIGSWPAAAAALASPLIVSAPGLGYEWGSYVWLGSGTWAQLWGMWLLPICLGSCWQAVSGRGRLWVAGLLLGATIAVHLLTGYFAVLALGVFVLARPSRLLPRAGRGALVAAAGVVTSAWMLVPLLVDARWAINDEFSRGTPFYDSFGGAQAMRWLVTGELFDRGRLPMLTLAAGLGVLVSIRSWRREPPRVLIGLTVLGLVLFSGRPTFAWLIDPLPGSEDLFLRRFVFGVHLAGLYLAGLGAVWAVTIAQRALARAEGVSVRGRTAVAIAAVVAVVCVPAAIERIGYATDNAAGIGAQRFATSVDGAGFTDLVAEAMARGDGRLFAGRRSPSPATYVIGSVPAYAALTNLQADAVGFARPTWSLATGAEFRLEAADAAMIDLFGVRYLLHPESAGAPEGWTEVGRSGRHVLTASPAGGYVRLVDTLPAIDVDRRTIGERTAWFLRSDLPEAGMVPLLRFPDTIRSDPTLDPGEIPSGPPGTIVEQRHDPAAGVYSATAKATRPAVAMFAVSYDPRFGAFVDGRQVTPEALAPGVMGVPVPEGRHDVELVYHPIGWYPALLAMALVGLVAMALVERWVRRRDRRSAEAHPGDETSAEVLESAVPRADDSGIVPAEGAGT